MGNMREISLDECRRVSGGGDIVVTGRKTVPKHENNAVDDLVRIRDSGWGDDYDRFDDDSGGRGGGGGGGDAAEEPELVDTDGDGVPDSPEIVVNGPDRLPDEWEEFSAWDKLQWTAAYLYSGSDWYADYMAGTNLSGVNPDDPYTTNKERLEIYGDTMADGVEMAVRPFQKNP